MQSVSSSWSGEIQTAETLYATRDIKFREEYRRPLLSAMGLEDGIRVLDVGCGPGLLVHRLGAWLEQSYIFGVDRDADFIAFARMKTKPQENACDFLVGDALSLPFPDNSFDAVTSHTVLEHLPNQEFMEEQFRVCRSGGVVSVLSSRPESSIHPEAWRRFLRDEQELWSRIDAAPKKTVWGRQVGSYSCQVRDVPRLFEDAGFKLVHAEFLAIPLIPDNAGSDPSLKKAILKTDRLVARDSILMAHRTHPGIWSDEEIRTLLHSVEHQFEQRMKALDRGISVWDISVGMLMIVRGIKP